MQAEGERAERIIYVDADGKPLPDRRGAVGGEIIVTNPDGSTEHILFTLGEPASRR